MRHSFAMTAGTIMDSLPSLAVLLAKTIGNVIPPSIDNLIFTLDAPSIVFVLFTAHLISFDCPRNQCSSFEP